METPKYFYRPDDYTIFKQQKDGKYSINDDKWIHNTYDLETLLLHEFIPCDERDFEWLKEKHDEYYAYLSWSCRSDGHGGCKGGTIDDYREAKRINEKIRKQLAEEAEE